MSSKAEVRDTGKYGKGVYAIVAIEKDELVSAVGGYIMTLDEYYSLPDELMHYPSQISEDIVLGIKDINDVEDAYYFNHSCEPNIGYGGQIFFRAMRFINAGEELTYDYGMELYPSETLTPEGKASFENLECSCGRKNCRKIITEYDWCIPELQEKYDGYFSWFIQEKIDLMKGRRPSK